MDYDSDDEYDMSVHMQPISYIASPACTEQNNSQCVSIKLQTVTQGSIDESIFARTRVHFNYSVTQ